MMKILRLLRLLIVCAFAGEPAPVNLSAGTFTPLETSLDKETYEAVDPPCVNSVVVN